MKYNTKISRITAILLVLIMTFTSFPCLSLAAAGGITVDFAQVESEPGESVQIPVTVTGNNGIATFRFKVSYDPNIKLVSVTKGSALTKGTMNYSANAEAGSVTFLWFSPEDLKINGTVILLEFRMPDDAKGIYPLTVTYKSNDILNENYQQIPCSVNNGAITVSGCLTGNHDLVKTPYKAPTHKAAGNIEYYTCGECGLLFEDAAGKLAISYSDTVIPKQEHEFSGYSSDKNGHWQICSCGEKTAVSAHSTVTVPETPPTCTKTGLSEKIYCSVCSYVIKAQISLPIKGHSYGNWVQVVAPTETTEGLEKQICSACGDESTRTIPVIAHTHKINTGEITREPTCTTKGSKTYRCSSCGVILRIVTLSALGHSYGDWIQVVAPTETKEGLEKQICSVCGDESTRTIPVLSHTHKSDNGNITKQPTCTEEGVISYTCTGCGNVLRTEPISATGHNYGDWIQVAAPTEAMEGLEKQVCSACGDEMTRSIPKLPHTHKINNGKVTKQPTCTEEGIKTYSCTGCGEVMKTETISATGHSYGDWIQVTAPTETKEGLEKQVCSACGDESTRTISVLSHTHKSDNGKVTKQPTCTEEGIKIYSCTGCGNVLRTEPISATGHNYGDWIQVTAPTETKEGLEKQVCSACGDEKTRKIPTLAHTHKSDNGKVTKQPTCTEEGIKTYSCTGCGEVMRTEVLYALGHSYGSWVRVKEPTETEDGLEKQNCTTCGDEKTRRVPALPHTHKSNNGTVTKMPSCTEEGIITYSCISCGEVLKTETLDMLPHTYGEWQTVTEPTETTEGLKKQVCKDCGNEITLVIPTLPHAHVRDEGTVTKEATCTEDGIITYKCIGCSEVISTDIVPMTDHQISDWVTIKDPSYLGNGESVRSCTVCGKIFDTKVIAKFTFADINEEKKAWYYDAVMYVADYGLMSGTGNNKFSPTLQVTRAQMVQILFNMEGQSADNYRGKTGFTDSDNAWYSPAIKWARVNGVTSGLSPTTFGPNKTLTRQELAQFIRAYSQFKGYNTSKTAELSGFADAASVASWAVPAMKWAVAEGLISGSKKNDKLYLNPKNTAVRSELAVIIMNYHKNISENNS